MGKHSNNKYDEQKDVFISYRREGGEDFARQLADSLEQKGYNVFLDVESIRPGTDFNERLYDVIDKCTDFILVLPKNGLDRCVNDEKDWVRLEIERAREKGKNIIPVRLRGFSTPENLPSSLEFLKKQHALTPTTEFYEAFVQKLTESLESKPKHKRNWWLISIIIVVFLVVGLLIFDKYSKYPHNQKQEDLVSQLVNYMVMNIQNYDLSNQAFIQGINETENYIEGRSKLDQEGILEFLEFQRSKNSNVEVKPFSNPEALIDSPFKPAEIDAFQDYLQNSYYFLDDFLSDVEIWIEIEIDRVYFLEYLKLLKEYAGLELEILFYGTNEMLLPVTNEDALKELKTERLPKISSMRSMTLLNDADQVKGKYEAAFSRIEEIYNTDIPKLYDRIGKDLDKLDLEKQLTIIELFKNDTDDPEMLAELDQIEERIYKNIARSEDMEAKEKELEIKQDELNKKKNELELKYSPLESDSQDMLWGKGSLFLRYNMNDTAKKCFDMYIAHSDNYVEEICGEAAAKFSENRDFLKISGGIVIFGYEEMMDQQDVEIGDIIYAVDGNPIINITEYSKAKNNDIKQTISILRFYDSGYELLSKTLDPDKGRLYCRTLILEDD